MVTRNGIGLLDHYAMLSTIDFDAICSPVF